MNGTIGTKSLAMTVKLCPSMENWKCPSTAELTSRSLYFFPASKTVSNFFPPPMQLASVESEQSKVLVPLMRPFSNMGGAPNFAVSHSWVTGI